MGKDKTRKKSQNVEM